MADRDPYKVLFTELCRQLEVACERSEQRDTNAFLLRLNIRGIIKGTSSIVEAMPGAFHSPPSPVGEAR